MIEYVKGDMFESDLPLIHGCNAQGVMGSGVAKRVRELYPDAYKLYRQHYEKHGLRLGEIIWYGNIFDRIIGNCITQEYYGKDGKRYVDYDAVEACLVKVNVTLKDFKAFGMPKIGAGLGGGDWNVIEDIIKKNCTVVKPVVFVY